MIVSGEHVIPTVTLAVTLAGMIVLAAWDVWRREVEDYAIIALLAIATVGFEMEGITSQQWATAVLSAAVSFTIYMHLGQQGVMGGGDVKLSAIPAFVLGASHPLMGVCWILVAIVIHQGLFFLNTRIQKEREGIPHVPAMALAALTASLAFPGSF